MVEEEGQGDAGNVQCACRDRRRKADVPIGVPAHPMPNPGVRHYEWYDTPDGKQPYYFTRRNEQPVTIAGLWDEWKDVETGERLKSCTMIITEANDFVSEVHDRMPVIL
jgi:hypothetical protein